MIKKIKANKRQFIGSLVVSTMMLLLLFSVFSLINTHFLIYNSNYIEIQNDYSHLSKEQEKNINISLANITKALKQPVSLIITDNVDVINKDICLIYCAAQNQIYIFFDKEIIDTLELKYNLIQDNIEYTEIYIRNNYTPTSFNEPKDVILINKIHICIFFISLLMIMAIIIKIFFYNLVKLRNIFFNEK